MTDFNEWSHENLASFARDANNKIKKFEFENNKAYFDGYKEGFAHARDELSKNCPKCASFDVSVLHTTVSNIDTSYRCCDDCGHQWRFE